MNFSDIVKYFPEALKAIWSTPPMDNDNDKGNVIQFPSDHAPKDISSFEVHVFIDGVQKYNHLAFEDKAKILNKLDQLVEALKAMEPKE